MLRVTISAAALAQPDLGVEARTELCVCIPKAPNCTCEVSTIYFCSLRSFALWIHCIIDLRFGVCDDVLIKCSFPSYHNTVLHCLKYQPPPVYFWIVDNGLESAVLQQTILRLMV